MQASIQSFLEAFSLFLVFSAQTKPNKTLHLNVIVANNNNKNISMLKYTFLIQTGLITFVFCCWNSWSLWGNSKHPDESRRVEIPKRVDALLNTVIEFNHKQE